MRQSKASRNTACFLLGLGVGVVTALVLAPQSGQETRRLITEKAKEGRDYLDRTSKKVRGRAEELMSRGSDLLTDGRERLAEAVETGRQTYRATLGR